MKKLFCLIIYLGILALASSAMAADIGSSYHITGCENGTLLVPIVHMWEKANRPCHVVGKLSGTSQSDKCHGAIVNILDKKVDNNGRLRYKIKSIVNGNVGWVSYFFVGKKVE